jgi:hypothetical protein
MVAVSIFVMAVLIRFAVVGYQASEKVSISDLPNGNLVFNVTKQNYQLGETITYSINNNYPSKMILSSDCPQEPLSVFYWEGGIWNPVHEYHNENQCSSTSDKIEIASKSTITQDYAAWPKLFQKRGDYRLVLGHSQYDKMYYQDFSVK